MKRIHLSLLTLAVNAALVGCVTRGKDFTSDTNWIKVEQTTQAEVSSLLGAPYKVGNSGGTPTWTYSYYKLQLLGEDQTKDLKLYWSDDKKVKDFSFTSSFPSDRQRALGTATGAGGAGKRASREEYP